MGNIQNMLDSLSGAKILTGTDIYSGYWNVSIQKNDRPKTAFLTPSSSGYPGGSFLVQTYAICWLVSKLNFSEPNRMPQLSNQDISIWVTFRRPNGA